MCTALLRKGTRQARVKAASQSPDLSGEESVRPSGVPLDLAIREPALGMVLPSESGFDSYQRGGEKARNGGQQHPEKEMRVTQLLLQPAAGHSRQQCAQRHEGGADGVMRGLMASARDVKQVKHVSREAKAVAELFDGDARPDDGVILRLCVREINVNDIR